MTAMLRRIVYNLSIMIQTLPILNLPHASVMYRVQASSLPWSLTFNELVECTSFRGFSDWLIARPSLISICLQLPLESLDTKPRSPQVVSLLQ